MVCVHTHMSYVYTYIICTYIYSYVTANNDVTHIWLWITYVYVYTSYVNVHSCICTYTHVCVRIRTCIHTHKCCMCCRMTLLNLKYDPYMGYFCEIYGALLRNLFNHHWPIAQGISRSHRTRSNHTTTKIFFAKIQSSIAQIHGSFVKYT